MFEHEQSVLNVEQAQTLSRTRYCWVVSYLADYTDWDWLWEPPPWQSQYTHVWPSKYHEFSGTYLVPKTQSIEYHHHSQPIPARHWPAKFTQLVEHCDFDYTWTPHAMDSPYIYVFGNQWWSAEKMPTVEYHVPGATERKYMSYPRATLLPSKDNWTVPDSIDYENFDFSWVPDPGSPPYIYQFATQHQKTGGPIYTVPGATEIKYLSDIRSRTTKVATAVFEIDHMDGNAGQIANTQRVVRYFDNYRDTLLRLARSIGDAHEYVWICSSVCDYSNFDFSWHPEAWQSTMLHVFASNEQKFGDTFFMHVPTFVQQAERKALLDWYDINYVPDIMVPRRPMPVIRHHADTHVDAVKQHTWVAPLTVFSTDTTNFVMPAVSLWRDKTKTIVPLNHSASTVIVPQAAAIYIRDQLYDYPLIDKTYRSHQDQLMDVIFISYDEPDAEKNWTLLTNKIHRAKRVHGVSGMEHALEAAADLSSTPWYYAVFAKTQIHENFDFSFVPDYMQQPKHYIFDCLNQSNNLQYGHMGIVLYNCQGIRQTNQCKNFGLDYTLSFLHESVPILSCYGDFAITPYHAWRTAFRECAKLAYFESELPTVDGQFRLKTWQKSAHGVNSQWVLQGAKDGVEFFENCKGNLHQLKQSFQWQWLRTYFENRHGNLQ